MGSLGGGSVPIMVTASAIPFADIKVTVIKDETKDAKGAVTDNSKGITPGTAAATLKLGSDSGVLGFTCNATVTGKTVKYKLDGTDKANFALSATSATVTAVKAGTKPAAPKLTIAVDTKSTASKTTITGLCPALGEAWLTLQPAEDTSAVMTKLESVTAAYKKFDATAKDRHTKMQWCNAAVVKKDTASSCTFRTASNRKYLAAVYCSTIEGWFFNSAKHTNVTSKDNGGKQVQMTMTYTKKIDDITDNADVLKVCGKVAEVMAVPYARVTDAYGGYFGAPSATLPAAPAATTTTTTTAKTNTTNKTRVLANATNATAKKVDYKINLFVQPDPFSDKVDNAATVKTLTGSSVTTAIAGVTSAKFGAATVTAAATTEAAVKWTKKPAATGGEKKISISATVDAAAYVYCAVGKTGTAARRFRMLNATNATNATKTTTTTTTAKTAEVVNLQSAASATKYNIQRKETKTGALSASFEFASLSEGTSYSWMCEATSLNPTNPAFRTAMEKGSASTNAKKVEPKADSALWSSLFAAVLMIAAVFFY